MPNGKNPRRPRKRVSKTLKSRIKSLETMVGKTIENKVSNYRSHPNTPQPVSTAGLAYLAFARGYNTGTAGNERIGNKITLMSQTFKGVIRAPVGTLDEQQNQVRLLIVENVGFTGVTDLELTDVLEYGNFAVDGAMVFVSPYKTNVDTTKRYRVHMDRVITLNKTDKGYVHFKKRIAYGKSGKALTFAGPLETFPNNHRLNLFVISDSAATAHPDILFNVRNIYKDA